MKTITRDVQPYPLLPCYLCGANVQIKSDDPFLFQVLPDGRSFNYCSYHLQVLLHYAPLSVIDQHRRKILAKQLSEKTYTKRYSLKHLIENLQWFVLNNKD